MILRSCQKLKVPRLARLLTSLVTSLVVIAVMQLSAYAVCSDCWNREVANNHLSDAQTYADTVQSELQSAQDALNGELSNEEPDYDAVESLNLQITELSNSLAAAQERINQCAQALRDIPPCMQNPPCGQGVPQDPEWPEDPPYEPDGPGLPDDPMPVDNPPPPDDPMPVDNPPPPEDPSPV